MTEEEKEAIKELIDSNNLSLNEKNIKNIMVVLVMQGIYTNLDAINKFLHCIRDNDVLIDILNDLEKSED